MRHRFPILLSLASGALLSGCGAVGNGATAGQQQSVVDAGLPPAQPASSGFGRVAVTFRMPENMRWTSAAVRLIPTTTLKLVITVSGNSAIQKKSFAASQLSSGTVAAEFVVAAGSGYTVVAEALGTGDAVLARAEQSDVSVPEAEAAQVNLTLGTATRPKVALTASSTTPNVRENVTFNAQVNGAVGSVSWSWTIDNGLTSFSAPPVTRQYLTAGQRVVTVRVTDQAGQVAEASVSITVVDPTANQPVLSVEPAQMDLGEVATGSEFLVKNMGTGTLKWSVVSDASWLTVSPASGAQTGWVAVTANRAALAVSRDPYRANLQFRQTDGSQIVNAVVIVKTPKLGLSYSQLDFGSVDSERQVTVQNHGSGDLRGWTASADQSWLTVSPTSGEQDAVATIRVARSGLAGGSYTGKVTFLSSFGSAVVNVTMSVAAATLLTDVTQLDFGSTATQRTVRVSASSGSLVWQATASQNWITVPGNGTTPSTVAVSIDRTKLGSGAARGTITFSSGQSTVQVDVSADGASTGDVSATIH